MLLEVRTAGLRWGEWNAAREGLVGERQVHLILDPDTNYMDVFSL